MLEDRFWPRPPFLLTLTFLPVCCPFIPTPKYTLLQLCKLEGKCLKTLMAKTVKEGGGGEPTPKHMLQSPTTLVLGSREENDLSTVTAGTVSEAGVIAFHFLNLKLTLLDVNKQYQNLIIFSFHRSLN